MTHLVKSLLNRSLLALVVLGAAPASQAVWAGDQKCPLGNATLRGTYMSHGSGTIVGLGPIAAVGLLIYDGKGNLVNPFTASANGNVGSATTYGTYTVNSDCTGTVRLGGSNYNFVVDADGSKVFWIETDAGTVFSGSAFRFGHSREDEE
jgi:hypothetical protein